MDCTYLIGAPGRAGAEWFSKECEQLGLDLTNNQVDVGVRVEVPAQVFEDITNESMKPNSYIQPSSMATGSALLHESQWVCRCRKYGWNRYGQRALLQ